MRREAIPAQDLDPSGPRRFLRELFGRRFLLLRRVVTLGIGATAMLLWSPFLALVFLALVGVTVLAKAYLWITSLRAFRSFFRPKRIIITPDGYWFVLLTMGVGVAALNTGVSLLYLVFSMMLSLLVISGVASESGYRKLRVERLLPAAVFCGEPFEMEAVVRNDKRLLSSHSISVEEVAIDAVRPLKEGFAPRVPPRGVVAVRLEAVARSRGVHVLRGLILKSIFPFGFFQKRLAFQLEETLLVYPRILPLEALSLEGDAPQEALKRLPLYVRGDEEFRGLQEYRDGDNPRRIHWPLSAKHGTLMVREMDRKRSARVAVLLETFCVADGWAKRFEHAVSLAASILYHAERRGYETILVMRRGARVTVEAGSGRRHMYRCMGRLARVRMERKPWADWIDEVDPALLRGASVFVVAAKQSHYSRRTERRMRRLCGFVRTVLGESNGDDGDPEAVA